ncbi:MAG TPA: FAD binding domain-containing protein [Pyrinomonadaceae bacterium]
MRAYLPSYELSVPRTLDDALALVRAEPGVWRPFAGGTDLMVLLEAGRLEHRKFFSIRHLEELRGVEESGGIAIQNRGTVGGNVANASPAADTPPALLAYDAEVELVSAGGARRVPYAEFHTGYKRTVMRDDELIAAVLLPVPRGGVRHFYRKVGTRRAQAISKVCFAALADVEGESLRDVRVALGSVAPAVLRCRRTEETLRGRRLDAEALRGAVEEIGREVTPIDDVRSTARYRTRVAQNLLREFLSGLQAGEGV